MYKIGDKIRLLDEPEKGVIISINGQRATIELENGFTEEILTSKLIKVKEVDYALDVLEDKHQETHIEIRPELTQEIDLHIENLFVEWKKIPKDDILHRQINAFKEELYLAHKNKLDKLIVIHGKGKGILKQAVIEILNTQQKISYQNMTLGKYKDAAIEIYFK